MTRFHIQVPECSYDYVVLPSMAWCATISTGWLVAGEWICSNILMKKGAMGAWDDSKDLLATAVGGLGWMTTLGYTSVDLKKSQTNRCLLGTGFLVFGTAILAKQWKSISVMAKVACFGHIASGLFMCCTKPKVGKTGGDAVVAAKK